MDVDTTAIIRSISLISLKFKRISGSLDRVYKMATVDQVNLTRVMELKRTLAIHLINKAVQTAVTSRRKTISCINSAIRLQT